jgi:23S rRNA (cytosine1962-C5)-methyltransferase
MFDHDQYCLLDFGAGRKLERWGALVLDRPAPAASAVPAHPSRWAAADGRFERSPGVPGVWRAPQPLPTRWQIRHAASVLELRPTSSGAVGVFPEQASNWDWIAHQVRRAGQRLRVLNLFAYTGGSTLAAAAAGAEVVHVDAARTAVSWARHNANLSRLAAAPLRWLVEDARKFVARELRRGNAYDAVILDPPTYGHGPGAHPWDIHKHLPDLLAACGQLTRRARTFMLLTCHTPQLGPATLATLLADAMCGGQRRGITAGDLVLGTEQGRALPSGWVVRWSRGESSPTS